MQSIIEDITVYKEDRKAIDKQTAENIAEFINDSMGDKFPYFKCRAEQILGWGVGIDVSLDTPPILPRPLFYEFPAYTAHDSLRFPCGAKIRVFHFDKLEN